MATSSTSIEDLRVYKASRKLEDEVYDLVRTLPQEEFYRLGNALRRSSAAVSHYITEAHRRHSYGFKLEALHLARVETEQLQQFLVECSQRNYADTKTLQNSAIGVTKQLWGLIKYFRGRQAGRSAMFDVSSVDDLVTARS
jgi:four helix bundle protein